MVDHEPSEDYRRALEEHSSALETYHNACLSYVTRLLNDEEFRSARAARKEADRRLAEATAREQERIRRGA